MRRAAVATRQRAEGYLAGDEAPPLLFTRFFEDIPSLDDLQPNARTRDPLAHGLPLQRQLAGGSEITFQRPIRPGDTLTAVRTLTGLQDKRSRRGAAIFCTLELALRYGRAEVVTPGEAVVRFACV